LSDDALIVTIASGRRPEVDRALRMLYLRHRRRLLWLFTTQGAALDAGLDAPNAHDMLQAWAVRVLRHAVQFRHAGRPGAAMAWMNRLAASAAADELAHWRELRVVRGVREAATVRGDDEAWETWLDDKALAHDEQAAVRLKRRVAVDEALAGFQRANPQRAAVLKLRLDGLPHEAIAQRIGRTVQATRRFHCDSCHQFKPHLEQALRWVD
jgi:DNA-directed RNA polymerase specialized sigma24 family protein